MGRKLHAVFILSFRGISQEGGAGGYLDNLVQFVYLRVLKKSHHNKIVVIVHHILFSQKLELVYLRIHPDQVLVDSHPHSNWFSIVDPFVPLIGNC